MEEGDRIGTNLIVEREPGSGAMGTVWLARNETLGSHVAVKVLQQAPRGVALERFMREARGLAKLHHPHIVRVYDCGTAASGEPYVVMELLRGEDLASRLEKTPVLPVDVVVEIAAQVCKALAAVAPSNVVHRDIKPANLFLLAGEDVFVKVLDFGVARFEGEGAALTRQGAVIGTPLYMSPEQFDGSMAVDQRSDLWSLAVVAYECIAGAPPFVADSTAALALAISRGEYLAPSFVDPALSPLDAFFARALAVDPGERFQAPREFSAALAAAAKAVRTTNPEPPAPSRAESHKGSGTEVMEAPSARATADPLATTAAGDQAPPRSSAGKPRRRLGMLAAAVMAVGALGFAVVHLTSPSDDPSGSSSAADGGAASSSGGEDRSPVVTSSADSAASTRAPPRARVTTMLDLPSTTSKNPQAVAAYEGAIRAIHDGNWLTAYDLIHEAHRLDPQDPQILFRRGVLYAIQGGKRTQDAREAFPAAYAIRDRLSPRDRGFLIALEPLAARDPPEEAEVSRRFDELVQAYPQDVEVLEYAGFFRIGIGRAEEGVRDLRRALELDPTYSDAYQALAQARRAVGDREGAFQLLRTCTERISNSGDCHRSLMDIHAIEGRCAEAEEAARRAIAVQPKARRALRSRADALFDLGRSAEVVRLALEERWAAFPEERPLTQALDEARLAAITGDLRGASRLADAAAEKAGRDLGSQAEVAILRAQIALELGDRAEADRIAAEYLSRAEVWPAPVSSFQDPTPLLLGVRRLAGKLSIEDVRAARASWMARWKIEAANAPSTWAIAFAEAAVEEPLARDAMDVAPPLDHEFSIDVATRAQVMVGRAQALAGRREEAVKTLRSAVRACRTLSNPILATQGQLWLAELVAESDPKEACAALGTVARRFGAEPSSVTATQARELARTLSCR